MSGIKQHNFTKIRITFFLLILYLFSPFYYNNIIHASEIFIDSSGTQIDLANVNLSVILIKFSDTGSTGFSEQDVERLMFTDEGSTKYYYEEVSFNKMSFTGHVYDWVTIPYTKPVTDDYRDCRLFEWIDSARAILEQNGNSLSDYNYSYYVFDDRIPACVYAGLAIHKAGIIYGGIIYGTNNDFSIYVFTHELGHAFGLGHANFLDCGSISIDSYENCEEFEYGDPYDVMGRTMTHLNAPHKMSLGWIPYSNALPISESGVYQISTVTQPSTSTQVLKIPKPDTREYYLVEYHNSVGFDANLEPRLLNGVSIRIWNNNPYRATRLIDPYPINGSTSNYRPLLYNNEQFEDNLNQITIKQISHDEISATVEVNVSQQQMQPYTIEGVLIDEFGNPLSIPGMGVIVERLDGSGVNYSALDMPQWKFENLETGYYSIMAHPIQGYRIVSASCGGCRWIPDEFLGGNRTTVTFSPTSSFEYITFKYIPIRGDANNDYKIDFIDYAIWRIHFGQATTNGITDGDFNNSNSVDFVDYAVWRLNFGT